MALAPPGKMMASAPPGMMGRPSGSFNGFGGMATGTMPPSTMGPSKTMGPSTMASLEPKEISLRAGKPLAASESAGGMRPVDHPGQTMSTSMSFAAGDGRIHNPTHTNPNLSRFGSAASSTMRPPEMASRRDSNKKKVMSSMVPIHHPAATMPTLGTSPPAPPGNASTTMNLHPAKQIEQGVPLEEVRLSDTFSLQVTQLLDMPIASRMLGGNKSYIVRVLDGNSKKSLAETKPITSTFSKDGRETVSVSGQEGVLQVRTSAPLVYVQVEHEGAAFAANGFIGIAHICRTDERSALVHAYALETDAGTLADCGIEIQVIEPSIHREYLGPMEHVPNQGMVAPKKGTEDIVAILEMDKITDLPQPTKQLAKPTVIIIVEAADAGWEEKELEKLGPFTALEEMSDPRLRMAFCRMTTQQFVNNGVKTTQEELAQISVRAPFHVGGEALEGAMYVRLAVYYVDRGSAHREVIGVTDSIPVFWYASPMQYAEIKPRGGTAALGGIHLKHRLGRGAPAQMKPSPVAKALKQPLGPLKVGAGGYKIGSEEERTFRAIENSQAQTRAARQRLKLNSHSADGGQDETGKMWMENGYRSWKDLDGLFGTMGPHPIMASSHVGPSVVRGYKEDSQAVHHVLNSFDEWDKKNPAGGASNPAVQKKGIRFTGKKTRVQEAMDVEMAEDLAGWMMNEDPHTVENIIRPVLCKDPQEILNAKDMSWCPREPMYVPIACLNERDKETLRLAQYDQNLSAKLAFSDVTPHYRPEQDVWGMAHKARQPKAKGMARPPGQARKVRDECPIA